MNPMQNLRHRTSHAAPTFAVAFAACAAFIAAGSASAQTQTPAKDPTLGDPSQDDAALDRQRRELSDEVLTPLAPRKTPSALPSVPGLSSIDYKLPNRKFFPEGTLLTGLVGTLVRSPMDDVIFLPDASTTDADGATVPQPNAPAMVLLPTQKLAQLTAATRGLDADTRIAITGQVFVYRDRQFLLPTTFAVRPKTAVKSTPEPAAESATNSNPTTTAKQTPTPDAKKPDPNAPTPTANTDPRVEDLIRDLESMRGPARVMDPSDTTSTPPATPPSTSPSSDPATPAPAEASEALTPEGTLLVNRRGRLTRSAATGGRIAIAFDNDPDSPVTGSMVVLPCSMLRSMEEVVATKSEDLAFIVSGRVLVYEGQNYLLPVLFQVRQTTDIRPQQ